LKFLLVGLGNVGEKYLDTRHNIGFLVLDALAKASNVFFESKRYAYRAQFRHKGRIFVLIKPATYVNLSGKAVNYWLKKEKVPIENLLIILDDIALPFETIRLRAKGGDGGHNGLKNINEVLGNQAYARMRIGIGKEFSKGRQVDYVLGEWTDEELLRLGKLKERTGEAIISFGLSGIQNTMNVYNTK